ncbi:MAG: hypothetical protein EAZ55_04355 [Cytophagales bacterium]|nr:MAG: hypothetical protein EAZ55_04355 [Cytophagales bacterium]
MRILYLTYDGLTDNLGQSQILPYLIGLAKRGHHFTIVSVEKKERYAMQASHIKTMLSEVNIIWEPCFYATFPPIFHAWFNYQRLYRKAYQVLKKNQNSPFHIVHSRSYLPMMAALALKKHFPLATLFDMRGFWADERKESGLWNTKNPIFGLIYRFFKRKEKKLLQEADAIISLTEKAKTYMLDNQWTTKPISVIPCCVATDFFCPTTMRRTLPEKSAFRVVYVGSLGTWYLVREMAMFFYQFWQQNPESIWQIITPDAPEKVYFYTDSIGIPRQAMTIQSAQRQAMPTLLEKADIALFFIQPSFAKIASSATKLGELLAMGLPVISNIHTGDQAFLQEKYDFGCLVNAFNTDEYQKAIAQIPHLLSRDKAHYRAVALAYFSLENGIEKYEQVYNHLLHKKSPQ